MMRECRMPTLGKWIGVSLPLLNLTKENNYDICGHDQHNLGVPPATSLANCLVSESCKLPRANWVSSYKGGTRLLSNLCYAVKLYDSTSNLSCENTNQEARSIWIEVEGPPRPQLLASGPVDRLWALGACLTSSLRPSGAQAVWPTQMWLDDALAFG